MKFLAQPLYPNDPVKKAFNKLWINRAGKLIFDAYHMTHAKNKIEFHENKIIVDKKLATLESTLDETPFFNGSEFSMVDIAYAPLFLGLNVFLSYITFIYSRITPNLAYGQRT